MHNGAVRANGERHPGASPARQPDDKLNVEKIEKWQNFAAFNPQSIVAPSEVRPVAGLLEQVVISACELEASCVAGVKTVAGLV